MRPSLPVSACRGTIAAVAVALLAGMVHAKPWKKWARGPLASGRTYAMFLARPSDSLSAAQLSWLAVQRDWRAQRDAALADTDRAWLVAENAAQQVARESQGGSSGVIGIALLAALVGALAAVAILAHAISYSYFPT